MSGDGSSPIKMCLSEEETGEVYVCEKFKMNAPVHYYTCIGESGRVDALLRQGECVNAVWKEMTPLHMAAHNGRVDVIRVLLKHHADVNATSLMERRTALHAASCRGCPEIVHMLITSRASVNRIDQSGVNALWWAAQHGHLEVCRYLIAQDIDVNKCNRVGISPLAVAVHNGHGDVVKLLVDAGCLVDLADFAGCTPLYHAVKTGYRYIVDCLVAAGADVNRGNNAGDYPVHIAALHGNAPILDLVIRAGCDVNVAAFAGSPIYSAVQRQHMNAIRMLIDGGANVDVQNENQYTPAPIIEAIREQLPNLQLITLLIQSGCNVNAKSQIFNVNTLEYAIMNNHDSVVKLLIEGDCNLPHNTDRLKELQGDHSIVRLVEEQGAQVTSLKRCCRKMIRATLGYGTNYRRKVEALHLPVLLKEFLLFKGLDLLLENLHLKK